MRYETPNTEKKKQRNTARAQNGGSGTITKLEKKKINEWLFKKPLSAIINNYYNMIKIQNHYLMRNTINEQK